MKITLQQFMANLLRKNHVDHVTIIRDDASSFDSFADHSFLSSYSESSLSSATLRRTLVPHDTDCSRFDANSGFKSDGPPRLPSRRWRNVMMWPQYNNLDSFMTTTIRCTKCTPSKMSSAIYRNGLQPRWIWSPKITIIATVFLHSRRAHILLFHPQEETQTQQIVQRNKLDRISTTTTSLHYSVFSFSLLLLDTVL